MLSFYVVSKKVIDGVLPVASKLLVLVSEESFSAQHEGLKLEKESLTKLQKECTAKRFVATGNLVLIYVCIDDTLTHLLIRSSLNEYSGTMLLNS